MFGDDFYPCKADRKLKDGDEISIGEVSFKVIFSPGHTLGGVLYYSEKENVVFTGDTLFCGSVGRTDGYGGSRTTLFETLEKIKKLPKDCLVFCGHGINTTIGHELDHNIFLR